MARKILIALLLCSSAAFAAGSSTDTVVTVEISSAPVPSTEQKPEVSANINSIISALNYKIELIQNRYVSLVSDMNALTASRKELTEGMAGEIAQQLKPMQDDIAQMATQVKLIRDEISQLQEDLGLLKSERKTKDK